MVYRWLPGRFGLLHGVEPYEVLQVLGAGRRLPRPVKDPLGIAMLAIYGRTDAGRHVVAVIRHDQGPDWLIVGAREMDPMETAAYDDWEGHQ